MNDIELSEEESKYLVYRDEEMMLFGDNRLYQCFVESKQNYIDGTFKSVNKELFYQLYTVHFESNGGVFPVFYALLPNKQKGTYEKLFRKIEDIVHVKVFHQEKVVLGDFEILGIKGLGSEIDRRICLFHFCQNLFRRAKKISFIEYKKRKSFHALCKSLMVFPLLPFDRIDEAFDFLKNKYNSENEKKMLEFFERNYLKGRFNRKHWWIYDLTKKTNNNVESFNSKFNRFVRVNNPSISKLINKLNKTVEDVHKKAVSIINYDNRPREKPKNREKSKSIRIIIETQ